MKICRAEIKNKFGGRCAYCGCLLDDRFHVDHVDAVYREDGKMLKPENHTEKNLFPSCRPCNLFKGVFTIDEFRGEIERQVERARKYSVNFRTAERFGQLSVSALPVVFWFEKYGLSGGGCGI